MLVSIRSRPAVLAILALLPGCHLYDGSGDDVPAVIDARPDEWRRVAVVDETPNREIDILVVVDNSGSMFEEQASLVANFPGMLNVLASVEGGLPDLHIAVISSNVGAGPYNIINCVATGDDGEFQVLPRTAGCSAPTGAFIVDVADGAGGRSTNYTGTLAETFACIAQLGTDGCGFEQHLESIRRSLDGSVPFNAGFLRPDAHLLIMVLADEDDCSTRDTEMFDTLQNTVSDPLGPLSSFRCFEFGVDCETGNADPRSPGVRTGCFPREDSPYMYGVQEYVDFLHALKADPTLVSVALITGNREPVAVGADPERPKNPALQAACESSAGRADPAVRLGWFADQFLARNVTTTICNADLSDAVVGAAALVNAATGTPCLTGEISGGLGELALSCRAFDVIGLDTAAEQRTPLPACAVNGGATPCLRFVSDDRCTLTEARASVVVERGGVAVPPATKVVVECPAP